MLVALVVDGAGQADLSSLRRDREEAAGIDEQAVTDGLLMERHSGRDQETGETRTRIQLT